MSNFHLTRWPLSLSLSGANRLLLLLLLLLLPILPAAAAERASWDEGGHKEPLFGPIKLEEGGRRRRRRKVGGRANWPEQQRQRRKRRPSFSSLQLPAPYCF